MNILFVAPNVCIDRNTADAIHVTELADNFTELGHNVFLIGRLEKSDTDNLKFRFKFKNVGSIYHGKFWIPYVMISSFFSILRLLINKKVDVIYERHHIFGVGVILGKIFRVPTIVEVNGIMIEEMKVLRSFSPLFIKLAQLIESFILQNTSCIISVTEGIKKYLNEKYEIPSDRIVTISNGVNIDLFRPIDNSKEILNLSSEFDYILFVGSLVDWQGVDTLIRASPLILNCMPNTHFIIVGDGPMKKVWMDLTHQMNAADNFFFTGTVPHEQVPLYINASDICIVPKNPLESGYSPLKLYEYMACGRPVVASNVSGFEILIDNNAGLLFESRDERELSSVILKLLRDKKLRQELGANGFRYIQKNYSWEKVAAQILTIYTSLHSSGD